MAITITDHRTIVNEADATTGWTGTTALFTTDPTPVESTGCLGSAVSTTTTDVYFTQTAANFTDVTVYIWTRPFGTMDTLTNGGVGIHLGDGTNRISFHVAGSDVSGFRHNTGPVEWQCVVMDTVNPPATTTTRAGSLANLNEASITQVGITYKTLSKAIGGVSNCFTDIMRYGDPSLNNGCYITVTGGTSIDPGTFLNIAQADRQIGNQQAYGVLRELATQSYGIQAPIRFGNSSGSDSSWFEDLNSTLIFEDVGLSTTRYKIVIVDNGVGTTTFILGNKIGTGQTATGDNGCSIIVPSGVGGEFDAQTDTDVTDVFLYGSTFSGFTNGFKMRTGQEFIGSTLTASGTFTPKGTLVYNSTISLSTAISAMKIDAVSEMDNIANCIFQSNDRAIEISVAGTYTFDNIRFIGNTFDIRNTSTGLVTITAINGSDPSTFTNTNGGTTVINISRTFDITNIVDGTEIRIFKQSDMSELAGAENVGASPSGLVNITVTSDPVNTGRYIATYTFNYSDFNAPTTIFVVAMSLEYQWLRASSQLINDDTSLQITQLLDRQYQA